MKATYFKSGEDLVFQDDYEDLFRGKKCSKEFYDSFELLSLDEVTDSMSLDGATDSNEKFKARYQLLGDSMAIGGDLNLALSSITNLEERLKIFLGFKEYEMQFKISESPTLVTLEKFKNDLKSLPDLRDNPEAEQQYLKSLAEIQKIASSYIHKLQHLSGDLTSFENFFSPVTKEDFLPSSSSKGSNPPKGIDKILNFVGFLNYLKNFGFINFIYQKKLEFNPDTKKEILGAELNIYNSINYLIQTLSGDFAVSEDFAKHFKMIQSKEAENQYKSFLERNAPRAQTDRYASLIESRRKKAEKEKEKEKQDALRVQKRNEEEALNKAKKAEEEALNKAKEAEEKAIKLEESKAKKLAKDEAKKLAKEKAEEERARKLAKDEAKKLAKEEAEKKAKEKAQAEAKKLEEKAQEEAKKLEEKKAQQLAKKEESFKKLVGKISDKVKADFTKFDQFFDFLNRYEKWVKPTERGFYGSRVYGPFLEGIFSKAKTRDSIKTDYDFYCVADGVFACCHDDESTKANFEKLFTDFNKIYTNFQIRFKEENGDKKSVNFNRFKKSLNLKLIATIDDEDLEFDLSFYDEKSKSQNLQWQLYGESIMVHKIEDDLQVVIKQNKLSEPREIDIVEFCKKMQEDENYILNPNIEAEGFLNRIANFRGIYQYLEGEKLDLVKSILIEKVGDKLLKELEDCKKYLSTLLDEGRFNEKKLRFENIIKLVEEDRILSTKVCKKTTEKISPIDAKSITEVSITGKTR